jgi:hypothetical protein
LEVSKRSSCPADPQGQCWWIRNAATTGGVNCKYCEMELDKGKEGITIPGSTTYPKLRGGWL